MAWRNSNGLFLPLDEALAREVAAERAGIQGGEPTPLPAVRFAPARMLEVVDPSTMLDAYLVMGQAQNSPQFLRATLTVAAAATGSVKLTIPPTGVSGIVRPIDAPGLPAHVITLNDYSGLAAVTLSVALSGVAADLLPATAFTEPVNLPAAMLPPWLTRSITYTVVNGGAGSVTMTADLRCAVVPASVQRAIQGYYQALTSGLQTVGD